MLPTGAPVEPDGRYLGASGDQFTRGIDGRREKPDTVLSRYPYIDSMITVADTGPTMRDRRLCIVGRVLWWVGLAFMGAVVLLWTLWVNEAYWTPFLLGSIVIRPSTTAGVAGLIGVALWSAALVLRLSRDPARSLRRRDRLRTVAVVAIAVPLTLIASFTAFVTLLVDEPVYVFDQSSPQGCQLAMHRYSSMWATSASFHTVPPDTRTLIRSATLGGRGNSHDGMYDNNPFDGGSWSLEWHGETAVLAAFGDLHEIPCGR